MIFKSFFICNYLLILFVSFYFRGKIQGNKLLNYFIYFLIYSLFTEILGFYIGVYKRINTFYIYNTWNLVNHFFYLFFFYKLIQNKRKKRALILISICYLIFTLITILFFRNFYNQPFINNIIIGSFIIVIAIMFYFMELLNSDVILNLKYSLFFWISLGIFLFNIGFIPIVVIGEYISFTGVFRYVTYALNLIMGTCFILGLVLSKKEYNKLTLTSLGE